MAAWLTQPTILSELENNYALKCLITQNVQVRLNVQWAHQLHV